MEKIFSRLKSLKNKEQLILGLVIALAFLIFLATVQNYGVSYDEPYLYDYADANLTVYSKFAFNQSFQSIFSFADLRYYGPAYLILGDGMKKLILWLLPMWDRYDAWHLINFSAFLFSAWMLFILSQRLVSKRAALFAALLYLTQPLLWGHAIMNPKDSPFMIFFVMTLALGVEMVEKIAGSDAAQTTAETPKGLSFTRFFVGRRMKYYSAFGLIVLAFVAADRIFHNFLSLPALSSLITSARLSPPGTILHTFFLQLASKSDQIGDAAYIEKAASLVNFIEFTILLLACLTLVTYILIKAGANVRWVILAGVVLGITISIRILGPAAGGLVIVYLLLKKPHNSLRFIFIYLVTSILSAFVLWPYLWNDTFNRVVECVQVMANFPWPGVVLFEGVFSRPKDLPWYYLIKLLAIQFTLPLVLLAVAGIGLSFYKIIKRVQGWVKYIIPLAWFLIPVAAEILLKLSLYNNFRQFLFVTPPLFILAAVAFDRLLQIIHIQEQRLTIALAVVLLAPGIIAQIWLFPLQYVYYNGLVGWSGQVQGQYETDYWETAVCQTAQYLNKNAREGSSVALHDTIWASMFIHCSRYNNFSILLGNPNSLSNGDIPDYAIGDARYPNSPSYYPNLPIMKTFGYGKLTFNVIRQSAK